MFEGRSIRFRLTVWYAAILTAGLGLFGGLIWLSLRQRLVSEVDRDLEGRAGRFERFFHTESADPGVTQLSDELGEFCQALPPGSSVDLRGAYGFVFHHSSGGPSKDTRANDARVLRRQFFHKGELFDLKMSAPMADVHHTMDLLRMLLWGLIPVVIVIACLGGAWLSGRALRPVRDVTAAAHRISIRNLSDRLPQSETGDELARLTEVLNTMLTRLDSAVKTLSQFVADASHELRTPLAVIRTTAELAIRRARTPESYRASLEEIAIEAERMTQLVEDLLTLARSDAGTTPMPEATVDVRDVLRDVLVEMRGLAEMRQISVSASLGERPANIFGSRPALHRLFVVLLDNALKYSHQAGQVVVAVESTESHVSVSVEDSGCGISKADLPHIFKRFYRADSARSGGGHGLGLSLAESIARVHGAKIEVRSAEGAWTVFRVAFPPRDGSFGLANPATEAGTVFQ